MTFLTFLAQQSNGVEQVAKNIGDTASTSAGYALMGIAACIAVGVVASRKYQALGLFLVVVFVVGGMVFAGDGVRRVIQDTWNSWL